MLSILRHCSRDQLATLLAERVAVMGEQRFCREAAREMVAATRAERVLPSTLAHFAPLLSRGLEYFLSCISARRLQSVIVGLITEDAEADENTRLFHLALRFPTLHKLGQIIARKPGIDPGIKAWLIQLEKGDYGSDPAIQLESIREQISCRIDAAESLDIAEEILAEASVATVIPFTWPAEGEAMSRKGVFKALKPHMREKLGEELQAIERTAVFLEEHRQDLGLKQMKLSELFAELRIDLEKEIDLAAEQRKLVEAATVYLGETGVRIPQLFPFCSKDITAMGFMEGRRVTEAGIPKEQRHELAGLVFRAVLCLPLFWEGDKALFHGDPHAGNILAVPGRSGGSPSIVLLDWALSGYLDKLQRGRIMRLLLGVLKEDSRAVARAIGSLAMDQSPGRWSGTAGLEEKLHTLMATPEYLGCDPLKKAFWLLEEVTMLGVVFPSELILYRKAFFTLEGVLHDISPDFSMAQGMERYLRQLLLRELPLRCGVSFMPMVDDASLYRTLLSNSDLNELLSHQLISVWQKAMDDCSSLAESNLNLAMKLMVLPGRLFFPCCF